MSEQPLPEWEREFLLKKHDATVLREAADVMRRRRKKKTFTGDVLIGVLERSAERLESAP